MPTATKNQPDIDPDEQQAADDAAFNDIVENNGGYDSYYDDQFNQIASHNSDLDAGIDSRVGEGSPSVYDAPSEGDAPDPSPNFSGGALPAENLKQAEENPSGGDNKNWDSKEFSNLAPEEASPFKYDPNSGETRGQHFKRVVFTADPKTKRRLGIGFVFGGGIFPGVLLSIFTLILPMKLEATMQNLKQYYFANTENVIAQRAGYLVEQYLATSLAQINATDGCGVINTVDKDCFVGTANTPVGALFQSWRQEKFENKLSDKYGITLRRETTGKRILTVQGRSIDFDQYRNGDNTNEAKLNRTNYRQNISKALEDEKFYKRIYYRYKIGKLLEVKYGLNRCVIACDLRQSVASRRKAIKQEYLKKMARIAINNRVMIPRAQFSVLVIGCIMDTSGPGCNTDPNVSSSGPNGQPGDRRSALETEISGYAQRAGLSVTPEAIERAARIIDDINTAGGYTEYFVAKTANRIAGEAGERLALGAIPVIGWINTAINVISQTAELGKFVRYANYSYHAVEAAQVFGTWASYADEVKLGFGDPDVTASMAGALSTGIADKPSGQTAELSPVWQEINSESTLPPTGSLFTPNKAFAASNDNALNYTCNDGTPLPAGEKLCSEEKFSGGSTLADVAGFLATPPLSVFGDIFTSIKTARDSVTGFVGNIVSSISSTVLESLPPYKALMANFNSILTEFAGKVTEKLFASAVSLTMSGARLFQVLAAGANVTASASNIDALGAPPVSNQAANALRQQAMAQRKEEFARKPLTERLFARNDTSSLVNRVALNTPANRSTFVANSVASVFSNPFSSMSNSLAGIFKSPQTYALSESGNPWNIPQAEWDPNDPMLETDPSKYTKEYCAQVNADWESSFTVNEENGQSVPTKGNPCLLEKTVVQSLMGYDDASVLDDGEETSPNTDTSTPANTTPTTPSGEIIKGDTYKGTSCPVGEDVSPAGGAKGFANGQPYLIRICKVRGITVNAQIAVNVDKLIRDAGDQGLKLTGGGFRDNDGQIAARKRNGCPDIFTAKASSCKTPTARPGYSNHQMGLAIDFGNCGSHSTACYKWLAANAKNYGLINLPSEPWHWSVDGK